MIYKLKSVFTVLKSFVWYYWVELILIGLIGLACWFRLQNINNFSKLSFSDGGRDVLVAKRLADGLTSWKIAPDFVGIFPNTPAYFLILGFTYKFFGGINGIIGLNFILGIGVIWLLFLIGKRLVDVQTGLVLAALGVFSPGLIVASQTVWQPNLQYFFVALAIYSWITAVILVKPAWYFLSQLAVIAMLAIYNGVLPVAGLLSLGLVVSWLKFAKRQPDFKRLTLKFLGLSCLLWFIWLGIIYGILLSFPEFNLNNIIYPLTGKASKLSLLAKLVKIFSLSNQLVSWQPSFLIPAIVAGVGLGAAYVNLRILKPLKRVVKKLNQIFLFFFLAYLSLGIGCLLPEGENFAWRITAQSMLLLILIGLLPALIFKKIWLRGIMYFIILGYLLSVNLYFISFRLKAIAMNDFLVSQKVAEIIQADVETNNLSKTNFGILVWTAHQSSNINFLVNYWESASIQLALELKNSAYVKRVKILPWPLISSNYFQPSTGDFYLICFEDISGENCPAEIKQVDEFWVKFLASTESPLMGKIDTFKLTRR